MRRMAGFIVFFLLNCPGTALSQVNWSYQLIERAATTLPGQTKIAVDQAGRLKMIYHIGGFTGPLRYGVLENGHWTVRSVGVYGAFNSFALDSNDNVFISYLELEPSPLKFIRAVPAPLAPETVDPSLGGMGFWNDIKVGGDGKIHISYYYLRYPDGTISDDLRYAMYDGANWSLDNVDTLGETGKYNSITLDSAGRPHIVYIELGSFLKHAVKGSGGWTIESVLGTFGSPGFNVASYMSADDTLHVVHMYGSLGVIRYLTLRNGIWSPEEEIAQSGPPHISSQNTIVVDNTGKVHVTFTHGTDNVLKYAVRDTTGIWTVDNVSRVGEFGGWASLALDSQGRPILGYFDVPSQSVIVAYGNYTDGDADGIPDVFDPSPANADSNGNGIVDGIDTSLVTYIGSSGTGGTTPPNSNNNSMSASQFFSCQAGSRDRFGSLDMNGWINILLLFSPGLLWWLFRRAGKSKG